MFSSVKIAFMRGEARPLRCRIVSDSTINGAHAICFSCLLIRGIFVSGPQEKGGTVGKNGADYHHGADGAVPRGLESVPLGGLSPPDDEEVLRGGRACDRQEAH